MTELGHHTVPVCSSRQIWSACPRQVPLNLPTTTQAGRSSADRLAVLFTSSPASIFFFKDALWNYISHKQLTHFSKRTMILYFLVTLTDPGIPPPGYSATLVSQIVEHTEIDEHLEQIAENLIVEHLIYTISIATNNRTPGIFFHCVNSQTRLTIRDTRVRLVPGFRDPGSVLILGQETQYGNPCLICITTEHVMAGVEYFE